MRIVILVLWFTGLVLAPPIGEAVVIDQDIVLAITFDEAGVRDLSPHGNDGILKAGARKIDGKFGKALSLNGSNQHVEIKNHDSLILFRSNFTMATWVNFATAPPKGTRGLKGFSMMGHNEGPGSTDKWIWWYTGGAIHLHINLKNCFCGKAGSAWVNSEDWDAKLNEWHQIVLVRVGNKYAYYLDGKPFGEFDDNTDPTPMPKTIDHDFTIGWSEGPFFFSGLLDEILIIKRPLNQEEILSHFQGGLSGFLSVQPRDKLPTTWANLKAGAHR